MRVLIQIMLLMIIIYLSFITGYNLNLVDVEIPPCNCDKVCESINYTTYFDDLGNQLKLKKTNCDPTYYLEGCEGSFSKVAYNTANERRYVLDKYDCTEFSQELARKLTNLGWTAKTKFVRVNCDLWGFGDDYTQEDCEDNRGGHMIVEVNKVYVEATNGKIIKPEDYDRYGLK